MNTELRASAYPFPVRRGLPTRQAVPLLARFLFRQWSAAGRLSASQARSADLFVSLPNCDLGRSSLPGRAALFSGGA